MLRRLIYPAYSTCVPTASASSISIRELARHEDTESTVKVQGWVERVQKRGKVNFLHINDGLSADTVQIVLPRNVCSSAPVGSAVSVMGSWQKSSGSQQNMELLAHTCDVMAKDSDPRYSSLSPDQLRNMTHLRSRNASFASILRLRSQLLSATHSFFASQDYVHIDTPLITGNDCEGAGETFSIMSGEKQEREAKSFFSRENVFLSVSGQLHLEAMCSGISRVYSINNGFRAEKQQSSSHLTEFHMLEAELAFCSSVEEVCALVEAYLKYVSNLVLNDKLMSKNVSVLGSFTDKDHTKIVNGIASAEFGRLRYEEAIGILKKNHQPLTGNGLNKQNEAFLVEYFGRIPVFVTHFPSSQKPLYMTRTCDGQLTESFDLLCPIVGELAGGSVRENSVDVLKERNINIDWYMECRLRGKPVSAGFGLGFDRLLQVLLGIRNIKDTLPFPRWFKHCQC